VRCRTRRNYWELEDPCLPLLRHLLPGSAVGRSS
jgi:hypothetical protein